MIKGLCAGILSGFIYTQLSPLLDFVDFPGCSLGGHKHSINCTSATVHSLTINEQTSSVVEAFGDSRPIVLSSKEEHQLKLVDLRVWKV